MARKRIAVVGSGCAGLGALWALKDSGHDVHLFEADEVLGGHTNTVTFTHNGKKTSVDTGFIVFNSATYPNFMKFLDSLGVEYVPTQMTFGVSRDAGAFEWAGTSLAGVFAQWSNILSLRMWRMIFDIVRFNQFALDLLYHAQDEEIDSTSSSSGSNGVSEPSKTQTEHTQLSIGEYIENHGYSDAFRDDYLIPMAAAVWSTSADKVSLQFPAITLVRFMWNHHLLNTFAARPSWMTIKAKSKSYIDAVLKDFPPQNVHLRCPITAIEDINDKVILQFENDDEDLFDHVILACHGDQAMEIIRDGGTQEERDILGAFQTSENIAYLHSDPALMPRRRGAWSAWNLITTTAAKPTISSSSGATTSLTPTSVCLTYNMNTLQHIPAKTFGPVLVTLNPKPTPDPSKVQGRWTYNHPLYTPAAIRAQAQLPRIQNTRGISYAGAWTKYGFHEDGFSSGVRVAIDHLGAVIPWDFVDSTFSRGRKPRLGLGDWLVRLGIWYVQLLISIVEFVFGVVFWPLGVGRYAKAKQRQFRKLE